MGRGNDFVLLFEYRYAEYKNIKRLYPCLNLLNLFFFIQTVIGYFSSVWSDLRRHSAVTKWFTPLFYVMYAVMLINLSLLRMYEIYYGRENIIRAHCAERSMA